MKTLRLFPLSLLLLLLTQVTALAWSGPGHAAVAAMAYRELSSQRKKNMVDILRSHPAFADWQKEFNQKKAGFPKELDLGMFLFIRAATWPDAIRGTSDPQLVGFDHGNWHFVNYPLRPPQFETGPGPAPDDDVLLGIREAREALSDENANPALRAAMLSWLIHLDGDIHQPLHCIALIEGQFQPPQGDRGGGLFLVYRNQSDANKKRTTKLHSFWDQQLGSSLTPDPVKALNDARSLKAAHARTKLGELSAGADQAAWSFESRDEASKNGYRFKGNRVRQRKVLPFGYAANANRIARRRLALAGYRLADDLKAASL